MDKHTVEQELAKVRDFMPRMWWALYQGAIQTGFSPLQAFVLLQTWIIGQNPNGIRPPDSNSNPNPQDAD